MLEVTLGLATFMQRAEVTSPDADFPLAVPFTMVAGGAIPGRVHRRTAFQPSRASGAPPAAAELT